MAPRSISGMTRFWSTVWRWLAQVGCLAAGVYADDLLDNLGTPSAREIPPSPSGRTLRQGG